MKPLQIRIGRTVIAVSRSPSTLGGGIQADIKIPDFTDSRIIAQIRHVAGRWILESTEPDDICVNGQPKGRFAYLLEGSRYLLTDCNVELEVVDERAASNGFDSNGFDSDAPGSGSSTGPITETHAPMSENVAVSTPDAATTAGGGRRLAPWTAAGITLVACLVGGVLGLQWASSDNNTDTLVAQNEQRPAVATVDRGTVEQAGAIHQAPHDGLPHPPAVQNDDAKLGQPAAQPADPAPPPIARGDVQVELLRLESGLVLSCGTGWLIRPDIIVAGADFLASISRATGHVDRADIVVQWQTGGETFSARIVSVKLAAGFDRDAPISPFNFGLGRLDRPLSEGEWQPLLQAESIEEDGTPLTVRAFADTDTAMPLREFQSKPVTLRSARWNAVKGSETRWGPPYLQLLFSGTAPRLAGTPVFSGDQVVGTTVWSASDGNTVSSVVAPVAYVLQLLAEFQTPQEQHPRDNSPPTATSSPTTGEASP